jgi:hypothetical protein
MDRPICRAANRSSSADCTPTGLAAHPVQQVLIPEEIPAIPGLVLRLDPGGATIVANAGHLAAGLRCITTSQSILSPPRAISVEAVVPTGRLLRNEAL